MEPTAPLKCPSAISPSGISTYRQCPLKFYFAKIAKLPDPSGEAALVGTFVHSVLAELLGLGSAERTAETARAIASAKWPQFKDEIVDLGLDEIGATAFKRSSWAKIVGYFDLEDPSGVVAVAIEQPYRCDLGGESGGAVYGILDRLDRRADGVVVVDYKTGKVPKPRYRQSTLDQLRIYAALVSIESGVTPISCSLYYVGAGEILTEEVTEETLVHVAELVSDTWSAIRSDMAERAFVAKPGPLCNWCSFSAICPARGGAGTGRGSRRSEVGEGARC
ncbi:MAG: RecB family exonuclease [Acidimicrobiales bacterium]